MPCQIPACNFSIYDEDALDMAIFISPQYKDDADILDAIYTYTDAVYADIGWNIGVICVDQEQNQYDLIKLLIDELHANNPIKTELFVGEDIGQKWEYHVQLNKRRPGCWGTGEYFAEDTPVAFLMPNADDDDLSKQEQIIYAFNKFSVNRNEQYANNVHAFIDTLWNPGIYNAEVIEGEIPKIGNLLLFENADRDVIDEIIYNQCKMFIAGGHANPSRVVVARAPKNTLYRAVDVANTNTQVLVVGGCYVNGWLIPDNIDKDTYYPPTKYKNPVGWFGHTIFESDSIQTIVAGFPIGIYAETTGNRFDMGFVCTGMDDLADGKTIAEAIGGKHNACHRNTIYGDPTFHY